MDADAAHRSADRKRAAAQAARDALIAAGGRPSLAADALGGLGFAAGVGLSALGLGDAAARAVEGAPKTPGERALAAAFDLGGRICARL